MAGVEALFESIGPIDMSDNDSLAARDNAISACKFNLFLFSRFVPDFYHFRRVQVSRIIRSMGDRLQSPELLTRWVLALPVLVDGDEMIPAMNLLLELILR